MLYIQNDNILIVIEIDRATIFGGFESLKIEDNQVIHQGALVFQQVSCF